MKRAKYLFTALIAATAIALTGASATADGAKIFVIGIESQWRSCFSLIFVPSDAVLRRD